MRICFDDELLYENYIFDVEKIVN